MTNREKKPASWKEHAESFRENIELFFCYKIHGESNRAIQSIPEGVKELCDETLDKVCKNILKSNAKDKEGMNNREELTKPSRCTESYIYNIASSVWDGLVYKANQGNERAYNRLFLFCEKSIKGYFRVTLWQFIQNDPSVLDELWNNTYVLARSNILRVPIDPANSIHTFFKNNADFVRRRFLYGNRISDDHFRKSQKEWLFKRYVERELLWVVLEMMIDKKEKKIFQSLARTIGELALEKCNNDLDNAAKMLSLRKEELNTILNYESALEPQDEVTDGGIRDRGKPIDQNQIQVKGAKSIEEIILMLEFLRICALPSSSKPHQFIAFGFSLVLDWGPKKVVAECSEKTLGVLAEELLEGIHETLCEELIEKERVRSYLMPLFERLEMKTKDVYPDNKKYKTLRGKCGNMLVKELYLKCFYPTTPESYISNWINRIKGRARKVLERGILNGGDKKVVDCRSKNKKGDKK